MERTLPRPLDWRTVGLTLLLSLSLFGTALQVALIVTGSDPLDFRVYGVAVRRGFDGTLYDAIEGISPYRYSPIAVFPLALVTWLPDLAWRGLHFAALLLLPRPLPLIALASFPFWFDVHAGNIVTFVVVAAYWALRGNRWATGIVLVTTLLAPRPFMLPLAAWILWKRPEWRVPFAGVFVLHAVAVLGTGYGPEWIAGALEAGENVGTLWDVGPSALIGWWWLVVAVPLAGWAFLRGYVATAGLLVQPYWLPYYLLLPLADFSRRARG